MEFEESHPDPPSNSESKTVKPPPLQDSKDYYNSTQKMTESMIQNP